MVKRRIKQRLSSEGVGSGTSQSSQNLSITVQQETTGLSGQLIQFSLFEGLRAKLIQANPGASLADS